MLLKLEKLVTLLLGGLAVSVTHADAPDLQTPTPVIYLADNLDEKDNLGWCIDTVGRGFAESLHAHSCKPNGGDVQFAYDAETLQITSVAFANKSVTVNETGSETDFGLLDSQAEANQHFIYDKDQMTFRSQANGMCIAVGETSRAAGPFMSRDLLLASCEDTAPEYLQWVILPNPTDPVDDLRFNGRKRYRGNA